MLFCSILRLICGSFCLAVDPIPFSVILLSPPILHQIESFASTGFVGFFMHR